MTYCVGIKVNEGMVFASDRRTNAGLDNFNSYSKMYVHKGIDRNIIILTSGNLATSQAVFNSITKDLEDDKNGNNLNNLFNLNEIAKYIGRLNVKHSSPDGINQETIELGSTFIVGGHIKDQESELYLVYPQGNFIKSSEFKPYLVIGEIKYGKPILDRVVKRKATYGDVELLSDVTKQIEGHTICAFGEGSAWPVQGLLRHFRKEVESRCREEPLIKKKLNNPYLVDQHLLENKNA